MRPHTGYRNLYDDGFCSDRDFYTREEADWRSTLPYIRKRVALIRVTPKPTRKP